MKKMELSPPWITFVNELRALFGSDPEINIVYLESSNEVKLYVTTDEKATALSRLIPTQKIFGNVILKITIIPANLKDIPSEDLFAAAFKNNPVLNRIQTIPSSPFGNMTYIIFEKKVVQFPNDEISDIYGNKSTLYQNIANDLFEPHMNIFFCTNSDDKITD